MKNRYHHLYNFLNKKDKGLNFNEHLFGELERIITYLAKGLNCETKIPLELKKLFEYES